MTQNMGLAFTVSDAAVVNWLKETLTLVSITVSGDSTRKAATSYATCKSTLIKTIIEAGDWAHTSMMNSHYNKCLPREVLVRILEQPVSKD